MLANTRASGERIDIIRGTPAVDGYGDPTGKWTFDLAAGRPLTRASLARPASTVALSEGVTLAQDEALLLVLRTFTDPAGTYLIRTADGRLWDATTDPVVRRSLASGTLSSVVLKRRAVRT